MRDRIESDELNHDVNGYRSNVITANPVESIFDCSDDIPELEPEIPRKPALHGNELVADFNKWRDEQ